MSSEGQALPGVASSGAQHDAVAWFWQFLKTELAPRPGRAWAVGRTTIAATLVMVWVMTFTIPFGFIGAINTFLLSRENPTATLRDALTAVLFTALGTVYSIVGIVTMIGDPLTHFLWITVSLFLAFYLIRIIPNYLAAANFGFTLAGTIPLWDEPLVPVNTRIENTLWFAGALAVGVAVTVAVEFIFRRVHPITDLTQGIENRLETVEGVLRQTAADLPFSAKLEEDISLYADLGTSRLRLYLYRSGGFPRDVTIKMNAAIAVLGRLVDLAASLRIVRSTQSIAPGRADCDRCLHLANEIFHLRRDLQQGRLPCSIEILSQPEPSELPFLPEMERAVALISQAFCGVRGAEDQLSPVAPVPEAHSGLLVPDAFSNLDHLKFAVRGTLATVLAYVVYQAIDWRGLSTAIPTCMITALSTTGASRQKQFLRLGGAIIGGFVFGMGAQVFVLPNLDSIAGFVVLFAAVTAISGWIATATPRLSYLGVQMALAFYLINLQEFSPQISLAIARDRVVGVLLGLLSMWLVFDRLWVRNALEEMQDLFSRNLRMLAELFEQWRQDDFQKATRRVMQLRDQINVGVNALRAQSDAVIFEFGQSRERKLRIRDDFRRWQPIFQTLLEVQTTFLQYRFDRRLPQLPPKIVEAQSACEENMALLVRSLSNYVAGESTATAPDVQASAEALRREIQEHYARSGLPVPSPLADTITLTQNLSSIVIPLYEDIHTTFPNPQDAGMHHRKIRLREA